MFRKSPVIRIEHDEKSMNWEWHPNSEKVGNVDVLSYEYEVPELISKGILPKNVQTGDTFLLSPYDDKYILIQDYEREVMQDKANRVAEIARRLGALHCHYEICVVEMKETTSDVEVYAGCKYVNVDVNVKNEEQNKMKNSIRVTSSYPNARIPSIADYKGACQYAKDHNLLRDSGVHPLLEGRNPETTNMLGEQGISINLSSDSQSVLDIAANLSILKGVFSLGFKYKDSFKYRKTVMMNINYKFAM